MPSLTEKEKQAMLILFKDFTTFYNANSLSKLLKITRIGALKLLKRLKKENVLISRKIGKSITYKINLDDDYNNKLIAFLMADEANNYKRWKEEFKELDKENRIMMLFGSVLKDYKTARDIDVLLVIKKEEFKEVHKILQEKRRLLPKKIHSIEMTATDLVKNIKNKEGATLDIVKNGVILYGQNKYVELVKEAQKEFLNYLK